MPAKLLGQDSHGEQMGVTPYHLGGGEVENAHIEGCH